MPKIKIDTLEQARGARLLSRDEVGREVCAADPASCCNRDRVRLIELGRVEPTDTEVAVMARLYGISAPAVRRMWQVSREPSREVEA